MIVIFLIKGNRILSVFKQKDVGASVMYKGKQYLWKALSDDLKYGIIE